MRNLWQDIRYSLRGLGKSPMFTVVALLSLALGIGANTEIFSLLDQALLRSLPIQHPGQLVLLSSPGPRRGRVDSNYDTDLTFSYPTYGDLRDYDPVFSGMLARCPVAFSMSWRDRTERVSGELVSGNYFDVLGVAAALGRTFTQDDDRKPGAQPIAMLSYAYWKTRFGSDPGVLNQSITLNSHQMTIVGVAQRSFKSVGTTEAPDVFVPIMMRPLLFDGGPELPGRHWMWLNIFARLKPGISREQAEGAIQTVWRPSLETEVKELTMQSEAARTLYLNRHLSLLPAAKGVSGAPRELGAGLIFLMSMVSLLLLIACANVANLLTARATARRREIGIRIALGAGRMRILRQLLVESLMLALAGGALGLLAAAWIGQVLLGFLPDDPSAQGITADPDVGVLVFALGLSVLTGVLFGLIPAVQGTRHGVAENLKDQAAAVIGGQTGFRRGLVVAQIALSLVLLISAGLFLRSLSNVENINAGFRTDHLISFSIQPSFSGYNQARTVALFGQLQQNIAGLPGVRAASLSQIGALAGDSDSSSIEIAGREPKQGQDHSVNNNFIGPGYFATMGIPLLTGRDFNQQDSAAAPRVAIANETMARSFFGDDNPLGQRVLFSRDKTTITIVGVVRDSKYASLRETPKPVLYFPYTQHPTAPKMTFYARTVRDPASMARSLQQQVHQMDASLPVFEVHTMEQQIDESIFTDRLVAALSTAFGALATILAAVGLYGVIAYMVALRTREIGIRMALGADRRRILHIVMREVALLAAIGIIIALAAGLAVGRIIGSQLFGVSGHDPAVFIAATTALALVAALAGYIPALRATRVDPLVALRYE